MIIIRHLSRHTQTHSLAYIQSLIPFPTKLLVLAPSLTSTSNVFPVPVILLSINYSQKLLQINVDLNLRFDCYRCLDSGLYFFIFIVIYVDQQYLAKLQSTWTKS